jgi:endonuclease/exonuclease/phosphatase family metal-dependent hydrolase
MSAERKKLGFFGRLWYWLNILFTIVLVASSLSSMIDPRWSAFIAILGLFYPVWLIVNILFLLYWMLRVRAQFLLSFIAILLTWSDLSSLVRFGRQEQVLNPDKGLTFMSYNVRMFNRYKWIKGDHVPVNIERIVDRQNPDVLCIQEYYERSTTPDFHFEYSFIWTPNYGKNYGMAIMSQLPIVDSGSVEYNPYVGLGMNKGFIWVDVLSGTDTLRVINVHLASMQLQENDFKIVDGELDISKQEELKEGIWKFGGRLGRALVKHAHQMDPIEDFIAKSPHPIVLCGDLNDTHSSYSYSQLDKQLDDSFVRIGKGFGKTYPRFWFPLRIDHIFVSPELRVNKHGVIWEEFSDHFPVVVEVSFE